MSLVAKLRLDYNCEEDTVKEVMKWVSVMSDREREILEKRLAGKSMRQIGREMDISHPTVSSIINSWDRLRESLEDATEEII